MNQYVYNNVRNLIIFQQKNKTYVQKNNIVRVNIKLNMIQNNQQNYVWIEINVMQQ